MPAQGPFKVKIVVNYLKAVWPFSPWPGADPSQRVESQALDGKTGTRRVTVNLGSSPVSKEFWTSSGNYIGRRVSDGLFHRDGHQIGYFAEGNEIYACDGSYLGEVRGSDRLITNPNKKLWARKTRIPVFEHSSKSFDLPPIVLLPGFEDFPADS